MLLPKPLAHVVFLLSATLLSAACQRSSPVKDALEKLDLVMGKKGEITAWKEARIGDLTTRLSRTDDALQQYWIYDNLYHEYYTYQIDSAMAMAHRKETVARRMNNPLLITDALLDLCSRYLVSGMYNNAKQILESLEFVDSLPPKRKMNYYQQLTSLHHGLKLTNKDQLLEDKLDSLEHHYRQLVFKAADSTMMYYQTYQAENDIDQGHPELGRKRMETFMQDRALPSDEIAILHYCIAKTYRLEKQMDQALMHYAISARYDLEQGIKPSRSLIQTARILKDKGEIKQAFTYITRAYEDATVADARICLEEIAQFMPIITSDYDQLNKRRFKEIVFILTLLAFFLTASIASLLVVRRLQVQVLQANKEIQTINANLQRQLLMVKEANDIKDSYLGRYLSMFSSHINSLEQYRSQLRNVAKGKDIGDIMQALRSDEFIEAQRETLYKEFDHTFLGVFPDFVTQLNALLKEGQHIGEGLTEGKLTNELRIFALIRLGVNESAQIAKFLKKSPSTIYNYRVKLRNAAICPNEEFEKQLMEIGK